MIARLVGENPVAAQSFAAPPSMPWRVLDHGGWEILLPRRPGSRWLCVDATAGATALLLSRACGEVHVVTRTDAEGAQLVEAARVLAVENLRLADPGILAGSKTPPRFDGFVLHDVKGVFDPERVRVALRAAASLVEPDGFVYVALLNRLGYTRLARRARGGASVHHFLPASVEAWMPAGMRLRRHPLIVDPAGRVLEIIQAGGYISVKNPSLARERARRVIVGPSGARVWSPGFAILARGERGAPSDLEQAVESLAARRPAREADVARTIRCCHVLSGGKVIVSLGQGPGEFGSDILVLVRDSRMVERRRNEGRALARLAAEHPKLERWIPTVREHEIDGLYMFAMREFPGVTLDAPGPALRAATAGVVRFLLELHLETRRTQQVGSADFDRLFAGMFAAARGRYPGLAPVLARLERALRSGLEGRSLPLVWIHGDFKLENAVVDKATSGLVGVIDWEHAQPEGLPLLDLWYLLAYNRQVERGESFLEAASVLFEPRELAGADVRWWDEYLDRLGVDAELVPALGGAMILHHCAVRMEYQDPRNIERLGELMERSIEWMQAPRQ